MIANSFKQNFRLIAWFIALKFFCLCRPENRKKLVIYRIQIELLTFFESNFSQLQMLLLLLGRKILLEYIFRFMIGIIKRQFWTYFSAGEKTVLGYVKDINERKKAHEYHACMSGLKDFNWKYTFEEFFLFCKQPRISQR